MTRQDLASDLAAALEAPGSELARAALVVARIEYPRLDAERYLDRLEAMGLAAQHAVAQAAERSGDSSLMAGIEAINEYLFGQEQFVGNRDKYEDPRNSCLNEVLDRRTGIPLTLSIVYLEVARRAGLPVDGINFPGHFLVQCPRIEHGRHAGVIIDPFHQGALLSEFDCRMMLQRHVGQKAAFSASLLAPATRRQVVVRMLLNLKHLYVEMRSYPQAHQVTGLLVALDPSSLVELRDRGLLACHLNDVSGALHDLQSYLSLSRLGGIDKDVRESHEKVWEHVKTLRRRVAALN